MEIFFIILQIVCCSYKEAFERERERKLKSLFPSTFMAQCTNAAAAIKCCFSYSIAAAIFRTLLTHATYTHYAKIYSGSI